MRALVEGEGVFRNATSRLPRASPASGASLARVPLRSAKGTVVVAGMARKGVLC